MSFEEFRIGKRHENDSQYSDSLAWLEKRLMRPPNIRASEAERLEQGGDNFEFVCWGDLSELKLWQK